MDWYDRTPTDDSIKLVTTTDFWNEFRLNSTVEHSGTTPPPQWGFLSLVVVPVWMLTGNGLVLLAVLCQRNLRNLSNRVIASLAFTDFLLALFVVPLGIYQLVGTAALVRFNMSSFYVNSRYVII